MNDNHPRYIEETGWRYDTLHSMHRRMQGHDYHERCIYMITMATEGRRPLFGVLRWQPGKPDEAWFDPAALGMEVEQCWLSIEKYNPGVVPLALQLMPDHLHGLLFVTKEHEAHLGKIINGFKIGCNKAFRKLNLQMISPTSASTAPQGSRSDKHPEHGLLFEPGYQDSILMGKGQLERMFRYIADNPRRLAVKKENPDLFRVVRRLVVKCQEALPEVRCPEAVPLETEREMVFAAIGNSWLLQKPDRMQVRCHNNERPENKRLIQSQKEYFLDRGRKGGVVVSPCISAGEKEIARAALEAGVPLIVILENGFPPMYKPPGRYFEACAKGLLLMLAPWPYHMERRTITRQQCLALNDMAYMLSTEPWTKDLEERLTNRKP